ncbi:hypothetical protein OFN34_30985, partial [Escherichia coli]|nr:hypothetical protein [Escherichia coli]
MFIANHQGNSFTHNDSKLLNHPFSQLGLNNNDITNAARSGTERRVSISGTDYVIYARPIEGTKLTTVTVLDHNSLVAPLYDAVWDQ